MATEEVAVARWVAVGKKVETWAEVEELREEQREELREEHPAELREEPKEESREEIQEGKRAARTVAAA